MPSAEREQAFDRDSHPDCRYCAERLAVNVGLLEENRQLKKRLADGDAPPASMQDRACSPADGDGLALDAVSALAVAYVNEPHSAAGTGMNIVATLALLDRMGWQLVRLAELLASEPAVEVARGYLDLANAEDLLSDLAARLASTQRGGADGD